MQTCWLLERVETFINFQLICPQNLAILFNSDFPIFQGPRVFKSVSDITKNQFVGCSQKNTQSEHFKIHQSISVQHWIINNFEMFSFFKELRDSAKCCQSFPSWKFNIFVSISEMKLDYINQKFENNPFSFQIVWTEM